MGYREKMTQSERITIFTIGHSTRPLYELLELLQENGVKVLVDVRTIPRSRHNPQYEWDSLVKSLRDSGIRYVGMKGLGGLRRPRPDSENHGWRNASFRGFADYMQTDSFAEDIERLAEIAEEEPSAVMCAEAVPWRCHRFLIADALLVRGFEVLHIIGKGAPKKHVMTRFAHVSGTRITYPQAGEE